jgi:hypothetical protein
MLHVGGLTDQMDRLPKAQTNDVTMIPKGVVDHGHGIAGIRPKVAEDRMTSGAWGLAPLFCRRWCGLPDGIGHWTPFDRSWRCRSSTD